MQEKINELFSRLNAKTVIIRNFQNSADPNFGYFSQLDAELFPGDFLVLHKNRKPALIASFFEAENAKNPAISVKAFDSRAELQKILKKELVGKKIGLNLETYPVNYLKRLKKLFKQKKFFDASKQLQEIRETKTKEEIKKIKNAVRISGESLERFPELIKKFKTEKAIAGEMDKLMIKNGADSVSFPTIVASGANSAIIHHAPSNKKIKKGELVLVDFGARKNFYCSDLTRMFCIGKPSEKQEELFNTVLEAKKTAEQLIKPEARAATIFEKTTAFLQQKGFETQHALGHGLGIETHDFPDGFRKKSKTILAPKMVLTIEPGIYGKFGGIRLEDDIVITRNGLRFLSRPQKELIRI